jgi:hypothetical protein
MKKGSHAGNRDDEHQTVPIILIVSSHDVSSGRIGGNMTLGVKFVQFAYDPKQIRPSTLPNPVATDGGVSARGFPKKAVCGFQTNFGDRRQP